MMAQQSCRLLHGWTKYVPLAQDPWSGPRHIRDRNQSTLQAAQVQIPSRQK